MKNPLFFAVLFCSTMLSAQVSPLLNPDGGGEFEFGHFNSCMTDAERQQISTEIDQNIRALKKAGKLPEANPEQAVSFAWPLRQAPGLNYYNYYGISNFVDQDPSAGLLDYNCTMRTYDGHKGTDIYTWPFPWHLYKNDYIEIIAAADGIIVSKQNGKDDMHCACEGSWNAVYVRHADGSVAWYGHMKKNSLTTKSIGQPVLAGEYLGVVASSGCSTGPHLHLEVYDTGNKLVDPYQGPCNSFNTDSWWESQEAYRNPTVNAILTHDAVPKHGCPDSSEVPHFSDQFSPGQTVYLAAYYKDQTSGSTSTYRIRRPDNSIWKSWVHTSPNTYNSSWWYWSNLLPNNGPFGTWTGEVVYNGNTYTHPFEYTDLAVGVKSANKNNLDLYPNPSTGLVYLRGLEQNSVDVQVFDCLGQAVLRTASTDGTVDLSALGNGVYFLAVRQMEEVAVFRVVLR